jgi:hypothetical protein
LAAILLTIFLANLAWSQNDAGSGLRGPVIGYVWDAAGQSIRRINGILGSSSLGESLTIPFPVAAAAVSASGNFAVLASSDRDPAVHIARSLGGSLVFSAIEGTIAADRVVLSSSQRAAALLSSDAKQLQMIWGLPDSPRAGPVVDASSVSGAITAIAIDEIGSKMLIATSADHGALYVVTSDPQSLPRLIADFSSPSAVVLFNNDRDAIVADAALNEITLVRDFAGTPIAFRLAGERGGISRPVGLWVTEDNRKLYVANAATRTLTLFDLDSQTIEANLPLDDEPTRLTLLSGSIFTMNDLGAGPLMLLNAADAPSVYFVPAGERR